MSPYQAGSYLINHQSTKAGNRFGKGYQRYLLANDRCLFKTYSA